MDLISDNAPDFNIGGQTPFEVPVNSTDRVLFCRKILLTQI